MNKDLIKYALIAVGAYLVYRYVQDHGGIGGLLGTSPVIASTNPTHTTTTPPATTTTPATTTPTASLKDRVAAAAAAIGSTLNLDQYCWVYAQESGRPCPDPDVAWPSVDRTQQLSFDAFWNLAQGAGLGMFTPAFQATYPSWLM